MSNLIINKRRCNARKTERLKHKDAFDKLFEIYYIRGDGRVKTRKEALELFLNSQLDK